MKLQTQTPGQSTTIAVPTNPISTPGGPPTSVPVATEAPGAGTEQPGATTSVPTAADQPTVPVAPETAVPTPAMPTLAITPPPQGSAAWNAVKLEYARFDAPRTYVAPASTLLWWYDPQTAQFVALGWVKGNITAQGQFRVRGQWVEALEVPFEVAGSYGLTLDASVIERIRRAGYTGDTIETFIYLAPDLVLGQ
ncbi:MAG TPA: hypothetical protein VGE07_23870 [Herpetosiphonaceae bacterium]